MTEPATNPANVLFHTILGSLLPFFLAAAGGNADVAGTAILELVDAHDAATVQELDLVGRIIGFSSAAMDNLRLSAAPDLPDAKSLRYRANAVALNRAADRCQTMLDTLQARRRDAAEGLSVAVDARAVPIMAPAGATAGHSIPSTEAGVGNVLAGNVPVDRVTVITPAAGPPAARPAGATQPATAYQHGIAEWTDRDLATMRQEARSMMEALSKRGADLASVAQSSLPDTMTAAKAAAKAALAGTVVQRDRTG